MKNTVQTTSTTTENGIIIATIVRLSTVFTQGLGQASSVMTGNALGAGDREGAHKRGVTFFALSALMVGFFGRSPGHWIMGLQVQTMNGRPAGFGRAAVRSLLICLVVPPLVVDEDHRGLHDRAVGTVLVRVR